MRVLADAQAVASMVDQLAHAVARDMAGLDQWALVGIRSRGDILADRLAQRLKPPHLGVLDITLYRDDLSEIANQPIVRTTEIDFDVDGVDIVLVDDVLMTGRSIRAALQSLMDLGRPRRVWLAVLVDRGGRELPIAPDFVGLNVAADPAIDHAHRVDVCLMPTDREDAVILTTRPQLGQQPASKESAR